MRSFGADRDKAAVLRHQFVEERAASHAISSASEMRVVALPKAGLHPLAYRARSAHRGAPIPKGAAVLVGHGALDFDHLIQVRKWSQTAALAILTVRWSDQKNA